MNYVLKRLICESYEEIYESTLNKIFPPIKNNLEEMMDMCYGRGVRSTEISRNYDLILCENAGALSSEGIRKITKLIYEGFLNLLEEKSKDKNEIFYKIPNINRSFDVMTNIIPLDIFNKIQTYIDIELHKRKKSIEKLKVDLHIGIEFRNISNIEGMILTTGEKNFVGIKLIINQNWNYQELLKNKNKIYNVLFHECKHLFDYITKGSLLNVDPNNQLKYLSNPQELHAFISNVILEIKDFYEKDKNCKFQDALNSSETWKRYESTVFPKINEFDRKNPKLRNRMLSKIVYWWNHDRN